MDQWTDRLSDYVDDELSPAEQAACRAHVDSCPRCRETVAALAALKADAQRLPVCMPEGDLWPGVLAQITREAPVASRHAASHTARRWSFTLGELALAATLVMAVSAGVTWLVAQRQAGDSPDGGPPVVAVDESFRGTSDVQFVGAADEHYDAAIVDLERVLLEQGHELDPQTIRVIERNLDTIDQAIRQARQALEDDPSNPYLNAYLVDSRRRKLDLLRRATLIASVTQGD